MRARHGWTAAWLAFCLAAPAVAQFPVGTQDVTFVDPERQREVPTNLYYPAVIAGANQAPADPPAGGFPVVAIGHGYQMSASLYAWVANDLAAHGFVAAVPRTGGELFPSHGAFGADLAFLARALKDAGQDPASPFFGRISDRTAVMGHSMGGGCSFLGAANDPGVTAVAAFAPAETNPSAIAACAQIARPALIFVGGNDCVAPADSHQIPMYQALPDGWRTMITLAGASHCQFAAYSFICGLGEGSCPPPTLTRTQQQNLTLSFLRPWLQAVLLADQAAEQTFQQLLATTPGISYQQEGQAVSAVPIDMSREVLVVRAAGQNPFRACLTLEVESSLPDPASVAIYDMAGRLVRILPAAAPPGQTTTLTWDGRDGAGRHQPAGVYLVRVRAAQQEVSLRVLRLR